MKRSLEISSNAPKGSELNTVEDASSGIGAFFEDHNENIDDDIDENHELGGPGPRKKRKKSSPVWLHFTEISVDGSDWGQCNHCIKKYKLSDKSNGSTGNLGRHLKNKHPDKWTENDKKEEEAFLSETCGLSISELETMAARQARQLETQDQLLAAKAQRLRFLKSGVEAERLQRLREKVATQEERLRKLRALRGKVQTSRSSNSALNTDLESLRAVFNEKEKELSLAVAKVDELTRQLEELRRGSKESINNGQSVAAVELEKLRRELMYRQKLREAQATRVAAQRAALTQRQEEALRVDRRIAELQERLHRKRLLNHQLAVTLKHQDNVDDFVSVSTKNDPKYQTLPYNTKLFAPFANKHDQENFEKSMQQMQIIQLDHLQSLHHHNHHQSQQQTQNQTKSVNFSNNIQLHHLISQNHHNAMSANNNALNQQKIHAVSQPTSSPIAASTTTAATTSIPNGLQTVHSTQANNNVSRGKAMPIAPGSSENVFPLVRPSNFLPTGAPSSTGSSSSSSAALPNLGINVLPNSQVGNTKETSSTASNASASGSSVSDGLSPCNNMGTSMTMTNLSSGGAPVRPAKHALPPKPAAKPTPPPRQQAQEAFSFANQRLPTSESSTGTTSSSGTSNNIMPDRSELPIKPKPLFLIKGPPGGNLSSKVSSVSASSNSSSTSADNDTTTVRMSMNRRIEMPPAFLFPESDPPPSDLVPEQLLLASLGQNQNAGSQSQRTSPPPNDVVDASPILQKPTNQNVLLPEEYTLPDLFPAHPNLSHSGYSINNNKETFFINNLVNSNCSNINQLSGGSVSPVGPSSTSSSISSTTSSNLNSNRGVNNTSNSNSGNLNEISGTSAAELITQQQHARNSVILEEQSEINKNNENNEKHISVMSIHVNVASEVPKGETTTTTPNQLESIEAVNDCGSVHSNDQSPDREESTSDSTNNSCSMSANAPGHLIVRRVKKGNLKSTNREHAPLGRRVSFDPLALLLDASLEGELDLVVKTAGEVGNASAANDEGITALHNAICAGHADVVRFLVEFGCDVNAQDSDGWTPLHCAASCNNAGMVKFLVERGACIFATTLSDHETAAAKCEEDEDGFGPCSEYLYSIQEKLGIMNGGVVFAVFDYDAQNPDELSFREADRLMILRKGDEFEREWWWATLGDQQGYVPRNLLGLYPRVVPQRRNES